MLPAQQIQQEVSSSMRQRIRRTNARNKTLVAPDDATARSVDYQLAEGILSFVASDATANVAPLHRYDLEKQAPLDEYTFSGFLFYNKKETAFYSFRMSSDTNDAHFISLHKFPLQEKFTGCASRNNRSSLHTYRLMVDQSIAGYEPDSADTARTNRVIRTITALAKARP